MLMSNKTEIFQDSPSSGEFKTCVNGHYYQGATCPYCKGNNNAKTDETIVIPGNNKDGVQHTDETKPLEYGQPIGHDTIRVNSPQNTGTHRGTEFGDDYETQDTFTPGGNTEGYDYRPMPPKSSPFSRKLVGWLVSYSNNPLGMDYKIFEGRNIIGRDMDCNISVNDGRVSGKHAVLLYRAGKYSVTDTQSSHGTFVNDEDIELEPRYINDGDVIRVGNTILKFRTSL